MIRHAKKLVVALAALAATAALAACGGGDGTTDSTSVSAGETVSGEFAPVAGAPAAYSGVAGEAELKRAAGTTTVRLSLSGLEPKTAYIAHLHTGSCQEADPGGAHFQFEKGGPEEPPNEIHLTFTSNGAGEGQATASSGREVPVGEAGAVVLHPDEEHAMAAYRPSEDPVRTVFAHEGEDHGAGGHGGSDMHSRPAKLACAELEGAASGAEAATGGESATGAMPTIVVRDGEPVGGVEELEFTAGEEIRFKVSSDAAEEIHVHGYDIAEEVPAGGTVEFDFPAEIEGIFEVELEELGVQILELRVNP